jgi:hypothetical protein
MEARPFLMFNLMGFRCNGIPFFYEVLLSGISNRFGLLCYGNLGSIYYIVKLIC